MYHVLLYILSTVEIIPPLPHAAMKGACRQNCILLEYAVGGWKWWAKFRLEKSALKCCVWSIAWGVPELNIVFTNFSTTPHCRLVASFESCRWNILVIHGRCEINNQAVEMEFISFLGLKHVFNSCSVILSCSINVFLPFTCSHHLSHDS